jgi:TetR/AcrR family transcriptional regulator, regulator of biofilm formation and stress response
MSATGIGSRPQEGREEATGVKAAQRAERRTAILEATARILGRDGLAAVTHRAVAREAGVPLAATTYYFSSKEELITEALGLFVDEEIARIGARAAELGDRLGSPTEAAAAMAEVMLPDAEAARGLLAKYEVYLEAARQPALREAAERWQDAFEALALVALQSIGLPEPERRAPLLVEAVDGILMHQLTAGIEATSAERLRPRLERLFALVVGEG